MPKTAPGWTIAAFTVIGLVVGRVTGAVVGLVIGVVAVLIVGAVVRKTQGGLMPAKVRRALATNLLAQRGATVRAALPSQEGVELLKAVELEIEKVAHRATTVARAPTHEGVWSPSNVAEAGSSLLQENPEPARAALYLGILAQMHRDWNSHPPFIQEVLEVGGVVDLGAEDYALAKDLERALHPLGRLRVGRGATGPTLEIVPADGDPLLSEPLLVLSSVYNMDEGRAILCAVQPQATMIAARLLPPRGFNEMGSFSSSLTIYSKPGTSSHSGAA